MKSVGYISIFLQILIHIIMLDFVQLFTSIHFELRVELHYNQLVHCNFIEDRQT